MPLMRRATFSLLLAVTPLGPAAAGCSVEASPVAFGTIDVLRQTRGTGEIIVRCDEPVAFRVGLSPGNGSGEGRRMDGPGSARLDYSLFADAGYSIPWGDGQAIGNPRAGTSDGDRPQRLTVYGIIPAQPGTLPGEYTDSLQVTLSF
jgi:spore coat protein U-like protein